METMMPIQKDLISKFGGFKPGELTIMTSGRQTGKSMYYQYAQQWDELFNKKPAFNIVASSLVDGKKWHTVAVASRVAVWLRTMNKSQWYEHTTRGSSFRTVFDMDEKLYTMLGMKFS